MTDLNFSIGQEIRNEEVFFIVNIAEKDTSRILYLPILQKLGEEAKELASFLRKQRCKEVGIAIGSPEEKTLSCNAIRIKAAHSLEAMQKLFENQSVGRVLIADYTTKAEFVIPDIAALIGPEKYEVVDRDIQIGLNNILIGDEKFANQSIKAQVFIERLEQARQHFINEFLLRHLFCF